MADDNAAKRIRMRVHVLYLGKHAAGTIFSSVHTTFFSVAEQYSILACAIVVHDVDTIHSSQKTFHTKNQQ